MKCEFSKICWGKVRSCKPYTCIYYKYFKRVEEKAYKKGRESIQDELYNKTISVLTKEATTLLLGYALDDLYKICDNQKTVSTLKLSTIINTIKECDRQRAVKLIELKNILDKKGN